MNEYTFTLVFAYQGRRDDEAVLGALAECGCDDAVAGVGRPGRIALTFDRRAESPWGAVASALRDARRAMPDAELIEASPDLVGFTEIAGIIGCSRQNVRQLIRSAGPTAPRPVHEGASMLWHLADVLRWLSTGKGYRIDPDLVELSALLAQLNLAVAARRADADTQERLAVLL